MVTEVVSPKPVKKGEVYTFMELVDMVRDDDATKERSNKQHIIFIIIMSQSIAVTITPSRRLVYKNNGNDNNNDKERDSIGKRSI